MSEHNEAVARAVASMRKHVQGASMVNVPGDQSSPYNYVTTMGVEGLAQEIGSPLLSLTRDEKRQAIRELLGSLEPEHGFQLRSRAGRAVWLQVSPYRQGFQPNFDTGRSRWIRLDTITQIVPEVAIGITEDRAEWLSSVTVVAAGERFDASPLLFFGTAVEAPVQMLMDLVSEHC